MGPTSASLSQLIATPLSERANRQFSHEGSLSPPAYTSSKAADPAVHLVHDDLILRVPKEAAVAEKFPRPSFRRYHSMVDQATPTARVCC